MTTPTTRRRTLTLLGAAAGFTALPVCAQATVPTLDEIGAVFRTLALDTRIYLQEVMAGVGYYDGATVYYDGAIDGLWGPAMARAYERLMASDLYQSAIPYLPDDRFVAASDTVHFLTNDKYLPEG